MNFDIEVNDAGLEEEFRRHPARFRKAVEVALYSETLPVFNQSQVEVPVDTGTLRSSGDISSPEWFGDRVTVTMGYGGAAADYAIYVHEILDNFHAPPTKAKFLEDPVMGAATGFGDRLGARVRAYLGAA